MCRPRKHTNRTPCLANSLINFSAPCSPFRTTPAEPPRLSEINKPSSALSVLTPSHSPVSSLTRSTPQSDFVTISFVCVFTEKRREPPNGTLSSVLLSITSKMSRGVKSASYDNHAFLLTIKYLIKGINQTVIRCNCCQQTRGVSITPIYEQNLNMAIETRKFPLRYHKNIVFFRYLNIEVCHQSVKETRSFLASNKTQYGAALNFFQI